MVRHLVLFVLFAAVAPASAHSQTDIYLRTERTGRGKIPVVVKNLEAAARDAQKSADYITKVLRRDLTFSGIFEPLQIPGTADTLPEGKTASAVFAGSLALEGERFVLDARLVDYSSREEIFSKRYRFSGKARRKVAHHLCDEICYFLVGERGIATTRLLFCRRGGEAKDLFVVDYDGFGEGKLTNGELTVSPLWLDGERICYTSYKRGNPDCYLVDLSRRKRTLISHRKGINIAGSYFAERDEIAATLSVKGNSEIYIIDSSGAFVRRLTRNRAIDCSPVWAPNGNEIAFLSDRSGTPQIYVMDKFGGNVRRLTASGNYNTSPAWSPLGDWIAYVSRNGWQYQLKVISPDGLIEETVFDDYLSYEDPAWAPNGRHIAATVRYGGTPWIVIIDTETEEKRRLVQGESPAWSPLAGIADDVF
jgi:TolB protein